MKKDFDKIIKAGDDLVDSIIKANWKDSHNKKHHLTAPTMHMGLAITQWKTLTKKVCPNCFTWIEDSNEGC